MGRRKGFVDPRPALREEFDRAVARLRDETGIPRTLRQRWRFWRIRRRLWRDMVERPGRSAHW